jgi:hypothetical protein
MRLVGFDEFCRMPAGTIFAPYKPIVLRGELEIKVDPGEEMPSDYEWLRHDFNGVMPLTPWLDDHCGLWEIGDTEEASFEIYDGCAVDYLDHEMFLVFDEADIDRMIKVLLWAKNGCKGEVDVS